MAERRIGIIMHGVTGRMGMNQHLIRSILAIRAEGGVALADGTRVMPEPLLVGRDARKLEALAAAHGLARWTLDLDAALADPRLRGVLRCRLDPAARRAAAARDRRGQARLLREAGRRAGSTTRSRVWRAAEAAGIRHGVVQDKLWLPGLLKLRMLIEAGFFGRILGVKGDFGYWVFEGDWQPAQRPSWNYKTAEGGGIILDMLCHWRYVLDNLFGAVERVFCLGANHIPERVDERGARYVADADDAAYAIFELAGGIVAQINSSWCTRVRKDDLVVFQVDGTHGSALAGLTRCWVQPRVATPRPVWNPDAGIERRLPRRLAGGAGQPHLRQRLQGAVGAVPAPRRGRAAGLPLEPARGRQGRPARRARLPELGRAPHAGRAAARGVRGDDAMPTIKLPTAVGHLAEYRLRGPKDFPARGSGPFNRVASPRRMWSPIRWPTSIRGSTSRSTGSGRSPIASTCGISGSASPRRWIPRSAAWGSTGPPRSS